MSKPDFSAQNGDLTNPDEQRAWFDKMAEEFKERGATFAQFSLYPDDKNLLLIEAWKERPNPVPEPHFHMTYLDP